MIILRMSNYDNLTCQKNYVFLRIKIIFWLDKMFFRNCSIMSLFFHFSLLSLVQIAFAPEVLNKLHFLSLPNKYFDLKSK